MVIGPLEMMLRMAAGTIAGTAIGIERERSGHAAGLRTHLLVALASTLFMLVSTQSYYFQHYEKSDLIALDPSRIAASVVSGVGFLGAGAILRTGLGIQGLTTAASLWLVAALGLAAGAGMYLETAVAVGTSLTALVVLRRVENKRVCRNLVRIEMKLGSVHARSPIIEQLRAIALEVVEVEYQHDFQTGEISNFFDLHLADDNALPLIVTYLEAIPDVRSVLIRHQNS